MGAGSVGNGTFRDSVDARVAAVGAAAYQPLEATLTGIAATAPTADQMLYATGADTFATTALSSFIRTLLDDTTATAALATLGARPDLEAIESQSGATYTLDAGDPNKVIQISRTSPDTCVVTFPTDATAAIPIGATGKIRQLGSGGVSFVAEAGATLNSPGGLLNISARYGTVEWHKRAANTFVLSGHLA